MKEHTVPLVIFKSKDQMLWDIVPPEEIPEKIRTDEDIIRRLNDGMGCYLADTETWYVGMRNE